MCLFYTVCFTPPQFGGFGTVMVVVGIVVGVLAVCCCQRWCSRCACCDPGGRLRPVKVHPWGQSLPLGAKFTLGVKVHPWGQSSSLGSKFTPRVKVHTWEQSSHKVQIFQLEFVARPSSKSTCPTTTLATEKSWFDNSELSETRDRCYDFYKYFRRKKSAKKSALLTQNKAKLCKNWIITSVFEKKLFAENCKKLWS
jgi:hypothetical protein